MEIDVREVEGVIILDMEGRLTAGTGDRVLREAMNQLVADDWKKIVLNLSEVRKIDSAGIGELMASVKLARRFSCDARLLNVKGQVLQILELSQLLPLLNVYQNEKEALASFKTSEPS